MVMNMCMMTTRTAIVMIMITGIITTILIQGMIMATITGTTTRIKT